MFDIRVCTSISVSYWFFGVSEPVVSERNNNTDSYTKLHIAFCITLKGEVYKYLNDKFLPHKRHTTFPLEILFMELTVCYESCTNTYMYCV